ncbi:MAG: helix-turn-helix domain-containing protein [Gammaproteobacteria bacterium]|nr:helix-turn-helix domain-containing protein [Gammaproteobacteria bacterium]
MNEKLTRITMHRHSSHRGKTNFARLNSMADAELEQNALDDPDNQPLTLEELSQFRPVKKRKAIDVRAIREKLGLSQEKFADYFGVSVRTLQDWEQKRHQPNRTALNFLIVVSKEPRAVQRALSA